MTAKITFNTAFALAYLRGMGDAVQAVTAKRHVARGWRWYSPAAQQMLTDDELVQYAENHYSLKGQS